MKQNIAIIFSVLSIIANIFYVSIAGTANSELTARVNTLSGQIVKTNSDVFGVAKMTVINTVYLLSKENDVNYPKVYQETEKLFTSTDIILSKVNENLLNR